jgi:hypothetical protein
MLMDNMDLLVYTNLVLLKKILHVKWVPAIMAWRILGLRMEERPPVVEGSCEYIE